MAGSSDEGIHGGARKREVGVAPVGGRGTGGCVWRARVLSLA